MGQNAVVDPVFPVVGGALTRWRGQGGHADLRRGHFLLKMYVKMKELGPIRARPLDPPMEWDNVILHRFDFSVKPNLQGAESDLVLCCNFF